MYIKTTNHKQVRPYLSALVLIWAVAITVIMVVVYRGANPEQSRPRFLNPAGEELIRPESERDQESSADGRR
ncbi:MAG: hypothetical protein WDZ79_01050 [Candidatus Paceibacterota bacterium]